MGLVEGLAELFAPTRCAGCEYPGALLCSACRASLPRIDAISACPRCAAPYGRMLCTECWDSELSFEAACALGELDGALARAVVLHKDAGERRLGDLLGGLLAEQIACEWLEWANAVVAVPATKAAKARRGFDHALAIGRGVARGREVPVLEVLQRHSVKDQRVLGRSDRARNSAGSFEVVAEVPRRVILVDDVLTTGATLDAAACSLLDAGCEAVRVAVIARAW